MKVRILVSFKDSVLDPQGQTVKNALHTLGYAGVKEVRQGKVADKVLANPIIEKFTWQIVEE
jgi:phosphoribosylformylglycinamidine synthase PurS subunit